MALSPWPASTMALRTATATLRAALGLGANATADPNFAYDDVDAKVQRLGAAVAAKVESYAPDVPQSCRDEAVIRAAAWLEDTQGAERPRGVGSITVEPAPMHTAPWFLHSGAAALLTRWKTRRAEAI